MTTPVKIGLLGLGTVGGGTVNVLARNTEEISRRTGKDIIVKSASVRDLSRPRICDCDGIALTEDPQEIVNDKDIDIVVELIGGETLAKDLVLAAIKNGKHIVTANKALIALHGNEIFAAAQQHNVVVAFEAAVAGGISIIKCIREGLAANKIQSLAGIINGTGNFILTEMHDKGRDFDDVLKEAQQLGYAEADPTFDVEGIDAAHKLTILASIAYGIPLQFDKVYTEGINHISVQDMAYAEELGYKIKHLGIARHSAEGVEMRVHPTLIPKQRLLANVDGVMNAVLVKGDAVGETLHYGAGAGAEPTASSIIADIVDITRQLATNKENRVPHLAFQPDAMRDIKVLAQDEFEAAYYLRMEVKDEPGVMSGLSGIFADLGISIEAINQKEPKKEAQTASVIMLTQRTQEKSIIQAINSIEAMQSIVSPVMKIRVEHLD